jgi:hypothetical protein
LASAARTAFPALQRAARNAAAGPTINLLPSFNNAGSNDILGMLGQITLGPLNDKTKQTIFVPTNASVFRLAYPDAGGQMEIPGKLSPDSSNAEIDGALEALSGIGAGNLTGFKHDALGSGVLTNIEQLMQPGLNPPFELGPLVIVGSPRNDSGLFDDSGHGAIIINANAEPAALQGRLTAFSKERTGVSGPVEDGIIIELEKKLDPNAAAIPASPRMGRVEFEDFESLEVKLGNVPLLIAEIIPWCSTAVTATTAGVGSRRLRTCSSKAATKPAPTHSAAPTAPPRRSTWCSACAIASRNYPRPRIGMPSSTTSPTTSRRSSWTKTRPRRNRRNSGTQASAAPARRETCGIPRANNRSFQGCRSPRATNFPASSAPNRRDKTSKNSAAHQNNEPFAH